MAVYKIFYAENIIILLKFYCILSHGFLFNSVDDTISEVKHIKSCMQKWSEKTKNQIFYNFNFLKNFESYNFIISKNADQIYILQNFETNEFVWNLIISSFLLVIVCFLFLISQAVDELMISFFSLFGIMHFYSL